MANVHAHNNILIFVKYSLLNRNLNEHNNELIEDIIRRENWFQTFKGEIKLRLVLATPLTFNFIFCGRVAGIRSKSSISK